MVTGCHASQESKPTETAITGRLKQNALILSIFLIHSFLFNQFLSLDVAI